MRNTLGFSVLVEQKFLVENNKQRLANNTKRDIQELETLRIDSADFRDILGKLEESFKFEFHIGEIENLFTIE